jgi:hypothetical protein
MIAPGSLERSQPKSRCINAVMIIDKHYHLLYGTVDLTRYERKHSKKSNFAIVAECRLDIFYFIYFLFIYHIENSLYR